MQSDILDFNIDNIGESVDDNESDLLKRIKETQLFESTDSLILRLITTNFYLFVMGGSKFWFVDNTSLTDPGPINFEIVFESVSDDLKAKMIFHLDLLSVNNSKTSEI